LKKETGKILEKAIMDTPELALCEADIEKSVKAVLECHARGGTVLVCGNGGSAADSEHIVGELMKGFLKKRPVPAEHRKLIGDDGLSKNLQGALPAISLSSQTSLITAFMNDVDPSMVFAQQVYGYRNENNVFIGITTSGNSENVVNAAKVAHAFGMTTIGMTGRTGGRLSKICDMTIKVPAEETYRVQEFHLPAYHAICAMVESEIFDE
jgi:phosphoheptose isomerase